MKSLIFGFILLGAASSARAALTPQEQAFRQKLDPAAQQRYTATREYVHLTHGIVAGKTDPLALGRKPAGFDKSYVSADEAKDIDRALDLSNLALMSDIHIA